MQIPFLHGLDEGVRAMFAAEVAPAAADPRPAAPRSPSPFFSLMDG